MSKPRRQFSAEFKLETVLEALRGEKTIAQICRERDIKDSLVYKWREHFEQHAAEVFGEGGTDQRYQAQAARIAELERVLGQLTLENAVLKKVQGWQLTPSRRSGG
jgi:transposase-like protein